jgi:hypothetical protein
VLTFPGTDLPVRCIFHFARDRAAGLRAPLQPERRRLQSSAERGRRALLRAHRSRHPRRRRGRRLPTSDLHPYPAAFEQCYGSRNGSSCTAPRSAPIRLGSRSAATSAGGCLAAAVRDAGRADWRFPLCLLVLDYAADRQHPGRSAGRRRAQPCRSRSLYGRRHRSARDPFVSPAPGAGRSVARMPRTVINRGGQCPFRAAKPRARPEAGVRPGTP